MDINIFEEIKGIRLDDSEYWMARDLAPLLGYTDFKKFQKVIDKAMVRCNLSGHDVAWHFAEIVIENLVGPANKVTMNYALSHYACHLIVQSGNPHYEGITLGKRYFYIKPGRSRKERQPVTFDHEAVLRLHERTELKQWNRLLAEVANNAGVCKSVEFAAFQNCGYRGLYGGMTKEGICFAKGLGRDTRLLDYMGSAEIVINKFRIAQTVDKLQRSHVKKAAEANELHMKVGSEIRAAIKRIGGTMPEDIPLSELSVDKVNKIHLTLLKEIASAAPLQSADASEEPDVDED